jgi:hypothetical protein
VRGFVERATRQDFARLLRETLTNLSDDETAEAFAAAFVKAEYPEWFVAVEPTRQGGRTQRGWPDGKYVDPATGYVYGYEITTRGASLKPDPKAAKRAVRSHLSDDVAKARAGRGGNLKGFVFIATAVTLETEETAEYRDSLVELGVEPRIITQRALADRLESPEHAIAARVLGVDIAPRPWSYLDKAPIIGKHYDDIHPLLDEYLEGFVGRSTQVHEVIERLASKRLALVRSPTASGKSVLAVHVGLHHLSRTSRPAYYIDCLNDVSRSMEDRAHAVFRERAAAGTLFIVDDIHADAVFVRDFTEAWIDESFGSSLLLLGKEVDESLPPGKRLGAVLGDLDDPILVIVTDRDLTAIYHRLSSRLNANVDPRPPTDDELVSWRTFKSDLFTFTLALQFRLSDPERSDLVLEASDAVEPVRRRYFEERHPEGRPFSADELEQRAREREALLDVAALGILDLGPDHDLVHPDLLARARGHGAVRNVVQGSRPLSKTVHSNYARAIIQAAGHNELILVDRLARLAGPAPEGFPDLLWPIIRKLRRADLLSARERERLIRLLLEKRLPSAEARHKALIPFPRTVGLMRQALDWLSEYSNLTPEHIAFLALADPSQIGLAVRRADIRDLEQTIEICERDFPTIATYLVGVLTEPDAIEAVIAASCLSGPSSVRAFLRSREQSRLRPIVLRKLEERGVAVRVADLLGGLPEVAPLIECLRDELRRDDLAAEVIKHSVETAPTKNPEVVELESGAVIADTLLTTGALPLDQVLIDRLSRCGGAAIIVALHGSDPRRVADIVARADVKLLDRTLSQVGRSSPKAEESLIQSIPRHVWARVQRERPMKPWEWYTVARRLRHAHCQHLVRASAVHVVGLQNHDAWEETKERRDPISTLAFACIAAQPHRRGRANVAELFKHVCTDDWLGSAYRRNSAYGVAASVFAAGGSLRQPFLDEIVRGGFYPLLGESFLGLAQRGHAMCRAIALLGAAAAVGEGFEQPTVIPAPDALDDALRTFAGRLSPPDTRLTYRALALWRGLKVLSDIAGREFVIPLDLAVVALRRWQASPPPTKKHEVIKNEMISWLDETIRHGSLG